MELRDYLRQVIAETRSEPEPKPDRESLILDSAAKFLTQSMRVYVAAAIDSWLEMDESDLDNGETFADRLAALLIGIIEQDGDLEGDELELFDALTEYAAEYLSELGADVADIEALLYEADDAAAIRVRDAASLTLPDGGGGDAMMKFAFDEESTASVFDAAYRDVVAFKNGQKITKRKRISGGAPRLSQKQKEHMREMRRKAHTATANFARAKSVGKRMKSGIGMKTKFT